MYQSEYQKIFNTLNKLYNCTCDIPTNSDICNDLYSDFDSYTNCSGMNIQLKEFFVYLAVLFILLTVFLFFRCLLRRIVEDDN